MNSLVRLTHEVGDICCTAPDNDWHATVSLDCARTVCGFALDADRSYDFESKDVKRGGITCSFCIAHIKDIKAIKL